ncbi:MAG: SDR family oxidoreductase, partial [Cyanobacteria bacterium J06558_2]
CKNQVKPLHFISTISVFAGTNQIILEDESLEINRSPVGGYTQSKWVAEKIVALAGDRGIPVTIHRPGRISGHSQTGACNPDDHTYRLIRGCIQLGSAPLDDSLVNLIPVDYTVRAIVYLSSQPESLGKTFHLFNPQPTPWNEIAESIISLGYSGEQVDYQQWRERLLSALETFPDNALAPLIATFAKQDTGNTEEGIEQQLAADNTNSGLKETGIVCPQIDQQIINAYITSMVNQGLIEAN